jgi:hypothetical protein
MPHANSISHVISEIVEQSETLKDRLRRHGVEPGAVNKDEAAA